MRSAVLNSEKRLCAEPVKQGRMRKTMNRFMMVISFGLLLAPVLSSGAAGKMKMIVGPTEENALAADQQLAKALQSNDTVGIVSLLDKGWAVVTSNGDVGEGPSIFPSGIKSGYRTLTTMSLSEPRVRLYGNMALVTTKVELAGMFAGKSFSIHERQTDVWCWKDGVWKCVLTQEAKMPEK